MGFKTEFNWLLKLKPENGLVDSSLEKNKICEFNKNDNRVYPLNVPIDLMNQSAEVLARVVIIEFLNQANKTKGKYKVIKLYNQEERRFLTKYWQEIISYE